MPQPITHYLVIEHAMSKASNPLWTGYNNFAGLGSFGPDLFYTKDIIKFKHDGLDYKKIADIMHWEGSFNFFCSMLDYIKTKLHPIEPSFYKTKAFAYGYYSHVVTDVIFHPVVYWVSKDHWKTHEPELYYLRHKKLEAMIDSFLVNKTFKMNPFEFNYPGRIKCYQNSDDETLDIEIFKMLKHCLKLVYEDYLNEVYSDYLEHYNYNDYFEQIDEDDEDLPIHDAYDDFVQTMEILFTYEKFLKIIPDNQLKALLPIEKLSDQNHEALTYNHYSIADNPDYERRSIEEFYELTVDAMVKIINDCEKFFEEKNKYASEFFSQLQNKAVYLDGDYCLDSGVLSKHNMDEALNSTEGEIRYNAFVGEMNENYERIA